MSIKCLIERLFEFVQYRNGTTLPRGNRIFPDRTSAHADPVLDRLAAGEIELGAAMPGQIQDFQLQM
jgi:hypothetical protein